MRKIKADAMDNNGSPLMVGNPARTPPHPLDAEWYVHIGGETFGPYSGHKVKELVSEGRITSSTDVVRLGSETWAAASADRALSGLFQTSPAPPPPAAAAGATVAGAGATIVQVHNTLSPAAVMSVDDGSSPKSAGLAAVLSFFIVGAGQVYNGQIGKGVLMFFGCILLWLVLLGWVINIWSIIDAYQTAKTQNLRFLRRLQAGAL